MEVLNWISANGFGLTIATIIIGPMIFDILIGIIKALKK